LILASRRGNGHAAPGSTARDVETVCASIGHVLTDTDPRAEAVIIEHLRRMTPAERLHRASELRSAALTLARARIRRWYGEIGEREMALRLASLWLDADTMRRVYGWDPDTERP
jgi:hypothetical protein